MDLYYFKGSPHSLRVIWFYTQLPENSKKEVNLIAAANTGDLIPVVKQVSNYKEGDNLTLPSMVYKDGDKKVLIGDGFEIVKFLAERSAKNEKDAFSTEFLKSQTVYQDWNEKTERGMDYARFLFVNSDDDFLRFLAPPADMKEASQGVKDFLKKKYYPENFTENTLKEVADVMEEADNSLKKHPYIIGKDFTYADMTFISMLDSFLPYNIEEPISLFGALTPQVVEKFKVHGWESKYPTVLKYRQVVMNSFPKELHQLAFLTLSRKVK